MIRYGGCIWGADELNAVVKVLQSGNWACGDRTAEFERKVARWQGREHALFVNSGSSALLLAMAALPPRSRVAMPALQFATLYSAALWCGHQPVLVDIDDSLNMDVTRLAEVIEDVDAVAFVHMAGNPTGIGDVAELCEVHGLPLVEDACEAMGAASQATRAGNFGLVSAFSTHGAHHIATGEGGLVFTDDHDAYLKARSIRDWGRGYGNRYLGALDGYYPGYVFGEAGLNLHATDMQAALGIVQLGRLDGFIQARQRNFAALADRTADLPFNIPQVGVSARPSWFTFPMLTGGAQRDRLMTHLADAGVESRPVVAGNMARQPVAGSQFSPQCYPVADKWFRRGLWVSVHPKLKDEELDTIVHALQDFWSSGD